MIMTKKILAIAMLSAFSLGVVNAGTVVVKNEDTTDVEVIFEPGDGALIKNNKEIRDTLPPGKEKSYDIREEHMGKTFSVKGTVTMPSLYNRCGPLINNQDYRVVFVGGKLGGVVCTSSPLDRSGH